LSTNLSRIYDFLVVNNVSLALNFSIPVLKIYCVNLSYTTTALSMVAASAVRAVAAAGRAVAAAGRAVAAAGRAVAAAGRAAPGRAAPGRAAYTKRILLHSKYQYCDTASILNE